MKRLQKKAQDEMPINENEVVPEDQDDLEQESEIDVEGAKLAVSALSSTVEDIFSLYEKLFNELNSLYKEYPSLYNEMKKLVRFPTNDDAHDITDMKKDLEFVSTHYQDTQYLAQIIDVFKK